VDLVHEIHTTELRSYRGCRRRHNWAFNENRQPVRTAIPLEFGIAFHKAMEAMYNPETWGAPRTLIAQFAEAAFRQECMEQKSNYLRVTERYGPDEEKERDYEKLVQLGVGMIYWYVNERLPVADFTVVKVEETFQVPILDERSEQLMCKCDLCWQKYCVDKGMDAEALQDYKVEIYREWDGLPVVFEGRVDIILRDKWGDYWIGDWKTTARMMTEDADIILEIDDQVTGYVWALRRKLNLAIRGFKYIELRKGYPEPPQKLRWTRLGRQYSVSQSQTTDVDTYIETVKEGDRAAYEAGLYDEFIQWLKDEGTRFIQTHTIYKTATQLDMFQKELLEQVREMINPATARYKSPGRFACSGCAFQQPCIDMDQGGDYQYALDTMFEIKPRYYVLNAPSTDKGLSN
jgi:PD-(D/E)XK nuclease superfamily protein